MEYEETELESLLVKIKKYHDNYLLEKNRTIKDNLKNIIEDLIQMVYDLIQEEDKNEQ